MLVCCWVHDAAHERLNWIAPTVHQAGGRIVGYITTAVGTVQRMVRRSRIPTKLGSGSLRAGEIQVNFRAQRRRGPLTGHLLPHVKPSVVAASRCRGKMPKQPMTQTFPEAASRARSALGPLIGLALQSCEAVVQSIGTRGNDDSVSAGQLLRSSS